ncbi:hypothetical protein VPJ54_15115, partial [Acinetobacter baumannii]
YRIHRIVVFIIRIKSRQRIVNQVIPFSNALYNIDRLGQ